MYIEVYKKNRKQSKYPLRQLMKNNACSSCFTATAGTKFVRTFYFNMGHYHNY